MDTTRTERTFSFINTPEQLVELVAASSQHPVVLFKHSPACGTSAQAYDELEEYLRDDADADVFVVNVLANRPLSQAIATRFQVRHESPQVLVLRNGDVRWHGSHFRVTADNVRAALRAAA